MPKKNENQNKSLPSECLVKFALKNVTNKRFFIDYFSLFDVYQLYESIYRNKLSMISPIIHDSKI
jgi:uncharacterized membrane protein